MTCVVFNKQEFDTVTKNINKYLNNCCFFAIMNYIPSLHTNLSKCKITTISRNKHYGAHYVEIR